MSETPTARELLNAIDRGESVTSGVGPDQHLAARVEAVLALIDSRWQVPAEVIVAQIKRILNGEKP